MKYSPTNEVEAALLHLLKTKWPIVPLAVVDEVIGSLTFENLHSSAKMLLDCYSPPPRYDFDHYFMNIALAVSGRHACPKRKVGAVLTKDNKLVATGYNGKGSNTLDCLLVSCAGAKYPAGSNVGLCEATHAEMNAVAQIRAGEADTLYTTVQPCRECATALLPYGLKRLVFMGDYPDTLGLKLLEEVGVQVVNFKPTYYLGFAV